MQSIKKLLASLLLVSIPAAAQDFTPGPYEVFLPYSAPKGSAWPGYARPDKKSPKVAKFALCYILTVKKVVNDEWLLVSYGPGKECYVPANSERLTSASSTEPCNPDSRGEFSRHTLHHYFEVVDSDPEGLNAHVPPGPPRQVGSDDPLPNEEVESWPVATQLKKGTILFGVSNVWVGQIVDSQKRAWMWFEAPDGKRYWVRANSKFIRPVPGPDPRL